jgi:hypothetical protein
LLLRRSGGSQLEARRPPPRGVGERLEGGVGEFGKTIKKLGIVVYTCHPSYMVSINRRITVQACPGINRRSCVKNN